MNKTSRHLALTAVLALSITGAYLSVSSDNQPASLVLSDMQQKKLSEHSHEHQARPTVMLEQYHRKSGSAGAEKEHSNALTAEQEALLQHPKVREYFDREHDKAALDSYFSEYPDARYSAEDIWNIIEKVEQEGRVFAYEALSLKLRWLEKNAENEFDFKARSEAIIKTYQDRALAAQRDYDPNKTPGFREYKKEEARIIQEAKTMQVFPEGMTRQEYLRKALLAARMQAYGG